MLGTEDFTGHGTVGDWGIAKSGLSGPGTATLSNGTGGTGGDFLQMNLTSPGPTFPVDAVVSNLNTYAGDYTSISGLGLFFDFYASNTLPSAVALFIADSSGNEWVLDLTPSVTSLGWTTLTSSFNEPGWFLGSGGGTFAAALADVQTIGLQISGTVSGSTDVFGIDNWTYAVPEPGTMAMLSAAFLSMAMTFRRNLNDTISRLRKKK